LRYYDVVRKLVNLADLLDRKGLEEIGDLLDRILFDQFWEELARIESYERVREEGRRAKAGR
jgi:hypothetical protein